MSYFVLIPMFLLDKKDKDRSIDESSNVMIHTAFPTSKQSNIRHYKFERNKSDYIDDKSSI